MGKQFYTVEQGYVAADMMRYAIDHRDAALELFKGDPSFMDSAAYLSHVSVEMMLKALALHVCGKYVGGHQLQDQIDLLQESEFDFSVSEDLNVDVAYINDAWDVRYPHPGNPKAVGHFHRDALIRIWNHCGEIVPQELRTATNSSSPNAKGGRILWVRNDSSNAHKATTKETSA